MPELVPPSDRYRTSFLAAVDEILATGGDERQAGLAVLPPVGGYAGEAYSREELADPATFAAYARRLVEAADAELPRPAGIVATTYLWWVEEDEYLGRISVRHVLNRWLREFGGHIGYAVRPSARRKGHATAMLSAVLPVAAGLGIDPALVTCDDTNTASRRVIEANGGRLEDQRGEKQRFWVTTGALRA